MQIRKLAVVGVFFVFWGGFFLPAQNQADRDAARRDVYVILDVSGSMNADQKFPRVKEYLNTEVLDGLLKTGDDFTLIPFGTGATERITRRINSDRDKEDIRASLSSLRADHDFTDIGAAMETLVGILEKRNVQDTRRVILFITDGKNAPPRESPYYGKDLSVDEKFRTMGEKISKGGWFLYVIGIGETDAKTIAEAVPGSVYTRTDEKLAEVEMQSYLDKVDAEAAAREAAEAAARKAAEDAEKARAGEEESWLSAFLRKIEELTGIPVSVLFGIAIGILVVILLLAAIILLRALRPVEIVVSDNIEGMANSLSRKIGPMKGIQLNSADGSLPGIGSEDTGVFRVERGVFGLKLRILDEDAIDAKSPYKKGGVHKLKGALVDLANGNRIRVAVKK